MGFALKERIHVELWDMYVLLSGLHQVSHPRLARYQIAIALFQRFSAICGDRTVGHTDRR